MNGQKLLTERIDSIFQGVWNETRLVVKQQGWCIGVETGEVQLLNVMFFDGDFGHCLQQIVTDSLASIGRIDDDVAQETQLARFDVVQVGEGHHVFVRAENGAIGSVIKVAFELLECQWKDSLGEHEVQFHRALREAADERQVFEASWAVGI